MNTPYDIMIDLESMGTGSNAAIIAIGAVRFCMVDGIVSEFYETVDLASSISFGLDMDPDTVLWWMQQDDAARREFKRSGSPLYAALNNLVEFIPEECNIWGNGATFDNVILSNAYYKCGIPRPWSFRNDRC